MALTRRKLAQFLTKQKPSQVAFEACGTAHYWSRVATAQGYASHILPAKAVAPYRQGHKTDANDALAVAEAARRPNIKEAPIKTVEQQALQAIQRSRERLAQERTALSNHLRGLLLEYGLVIPQGSAALGCRVSEILEDGDNELPNLYRPTLAHLYERLRQLHADIRFLDREVAQWVKHHDACARLMCWRESVPSDPFCPSPHWARA